MKAQNEESRSLKLALLQRAVQAEQRVLLVPRARQSSTQPASVQALSNGHGHLVAVAGSPEADSGGPAGIPYKSTEFHREMVAKLNELNQVNLTQVLVAMPGANQIPQNG